MNKKRVIVAMSGGVDSSVAALILQNQGYDVIGMTLRLWSSEDDSEVGEVHNKRCCSVEDVEDARNVCDVLGIPHYFVNFEKEFQEIMTPENADESHEFVEYFAECEEQFKKYPITLRELFD